MIGADSVATPIDERIATWNSIAASLRPPALDDALVHEVTLDDLDHVLTEIHAGRVSGRTVVRIAA